MDGTSTNDSSARQQIMKPSSIRSQKDRQVAQIERQLAEEPSKETQGRGPALWGFYFIAIVLMGFYRIDRTIHTQNLSKLAASRTQAAVGAK